MSGGIFTLLVLVVMVGQILLGIPIMVALGLTSIGGMWLLTGSFDTALSLLGTTAYESVRDYVFLVLPLFILMGELMARSGCAADLYQLMNRVFRRVPGRLAVATVGGQAIFASVIGVSVAAAASFSRVAYPEMKRRGYDRKMALGCIAGSSALGMLIPPSVLMIVWGVMTELSIGQLFVAGILPGLLVALVYVAWLIMLAMLRPELFGGPPRAAVAATVGPSVGTVPGSQSSSSASAAATRTVEPAEEGIGSLVGSIGTLLMVLVVVGGIWFGVFTPTEAAGVSVILALILARARGLSFAEFRQAVLAAGRMAAPILMLLVFAQMYSRMLAMGGVFGEVQQAMTGLGLSPFALILLMVLIWLVLGCFIDSISIILLTVPIFAPLAASMGIHPIAFAIIGILIIEAGFVTPPFGLIVFTVKAAVDDPDVTLGDVFIACIPYWILLVGMAGLIYFVPSIATWLPSLM